MHPVSISVERLSYRVLTAAAPTVEGPSDVWETDWIDAASFRLLRYVTVESALSDGPSGVFSSAILYPPDGSPLRDCPTTPSLSRSALEPLAMPVG